MPITATPCATISRGVHYSPGAILLRVPFVFLTLAFGLSGQEVRISPSADVHPLAHPLAPPPAPKLGAHVTLTNSPTVTITGFSAKADRVEVSSPTRLDARKSRASGSSLGSVRGGGLSRMPMGIWRSVGKQGIRIAPATVF